jgi:non-ribosomal peptide synthetase component F
MYSAQIRGEEPELAPLVCRYVDAVLEERRQSPHQRGLIDHWTKVLEGAPRSLDLPTDHPRPPVQDFRGAHLSFEVTGELLGALRDMARVERTTLYVILFAAFAVLLGQVCGKSDLVIGSTVAGRAQPQWHPIVGCFINTLPVRLQVSRQERVADFIARARRVMIDAWAHQAVPVDRVIAALRLAPDLSQTPLYQAAMSLQNYPRHGLLLEGCTTQEMVPPHIATPVDLSLHVRQSSDSLQASLHYSTALLDARTVAGYAAAYENVLRQLVTGGAARVHDLL